MNGCHECRYHLDNVDNPYARCLIFYNQGIAVSKLRAGLIGKCEEFKERGNSEKLTA